MIELTPLSITIMVAVFVAIVITFAIFIRRELK